MKRARAAMAICAFMATCAATSCASVPDGGAGGDKAGGRDGKVVLRLAQTGYGPGDSLAYFVGRVEKDSGGQVRVSLVNRFGGYAPDAEIQVVRAVASGKIDLGWVGSESFDTLGVSSLTALSAPMLVDSLRLARVVLAGRTGHAMLGGLKSAGVSGIAAMAGFVHVPISADRALVDPRRWQGIGFGTYASAVQEQAIRALGAAPVAGFGPLRSHALSVHTIAGFDLAVQGYVALDLVSQAPYVAVNVPLWTGVDVAFANPKVLSSLSRQQRRWVQDAAAQTVAHANSSDDETNALIREACSQGARFVSATPSQLVAFRDAFAGVYTELEKDPRTKGYIAQIRRLKAAAPPAEAPEIPRGCAGER